MFRSVLLWLMITSGIAIFWPVQTLGFDPFVPTPGLLWTLIVVTMFSLGTLVRRSELIPLRQTSLVGFARRACASVGDAHCGLVGHASDPNVNRTCRGSHLGRLCSGCDGVECLNPYRRRKRCLFGHVNDDRDAVVTA